MPALTLLEWIVVALVLLGLLNLLLSCLIAARSGGGRVAAVSERLERELRDEMGRQTQVTRGDLGTFQSMLLAQSGDVARTQNEQIDSFRGQLATSAQHTEATLRRFSETLTAQLQRLSDANERRLGDVRLAVDTRLAALQEGNEKKLDQMRATVDEKLHATLEQRLGESFKLVADRLDSVHRGLGEMQKLASDVGALNRVLTNVKTRGVFGEVQLAGLLEQVFTPEQYGANVATVPDSNERVEYAIRLPGRDIEGHASAPLWLPIDAKFPRDDYERLIEASERGDLASMEQSAKAIEARLRMEARRIRDKYVCPPHTTDFAILFLPTEGLYAEALRRPGLGEALQRECKVMLAGPTTLLALLNSLQMGFRTLALERRSAEVWQVLGAVKTEFGKFGAVLEKTRRKLQEASSTIEKAETRSRVMTRRLSSVEAMPEGPAAQLLAGIGDPVADDEPDESSTDDRGG